MDSIHITTSFAVWSAIVGMIGIAIVWELSRLRADAKEVAMRLNKYIITMERRMTHIEAHLQMKLGGVFTPNRNNEDDNA